MTEDSIFKLMANPKEEIVWGLGYVVTGINIKYKESTVLLMVKAHGQLGHKKIVFIEAATVWDCWAYLAAACYTTGVMLTWRDDQW